MCRIALCPPAAECKPFFKVCISIHSSQQTKFLLGFLLRGYPKLTQGQPFLCITHIHPDSHVAADLDWLGQPLPLAELVVLLACRDQPGAFAFRRTSLNCYPSLAHNASCVSFASSYAELRYRAPQRSYLPLSDQQYCLRGNCVAPYACADSLQTRQCMQLHLSRTSSTRKPLHKYHGNMANGQ